MKTVNLVTFKVDQIAVDDMRNCIEYTRQGQCINKVRNSNEYVPSFVYVETSNIQLIVDQGVKHYMAVGDKVWEYIHLMKNPVTGATLQHKLKHLREYQAKARVTIEFQNIKLARVKKAGFWKRFKWLFTGVKT